ncbi:TetR/AcrR family transcriptional regulator [Microbacterium sp. MPKO10]|uniref:TetR/AcrR family transcriptional regulator n=1 Tax=Microbacterium sp. MPKO10 TaxID=2989818 RepID=UPI00223613BB|nr:TetR/AcrR family transcriptional regulator [Microbacterium sp. MPKO10]MCW4458780.1 TetR/AcrR family transcriptional regulator [Microbacterium sp. MPKO10]
MNRKRRLTREEQKMRTREELRASAAQLFAEKGVNGASVEQIAENAGYSRGAFYSNFKDKNELVSELLEERTRCELEEVTQITAGKAPFDALRDWHRARAENLDDWLSLRTELLLYAMRNPSFRPRMADCERVALHAHESSIESAAAGAHAELPAPAQLLALILHTLEDGLLFQRMLFPDEISDEVVVDAAELLLRTWLRSSSDG